MDTPQILEKLPDPESGYNPEWDRKFAQSIPSNDTSLPKMSIVTPSFNQGRFIEQTIRCILLQGYPNLEFIIIDGVSTDKSVEIIKKYDPWISYWVSEPDDGMYDAINKGFARSTGELMGWSPTSDFYEPNALNIIGHSFQQNKQMNWLTSCCKVLCDESLNETARYLVEGYSRKAFMKGINFLGGNPYARFMIQQQSTFWRRCLWDKSGGRMDDSMKGAGDFELWARFFFNGARLFSTDVALGVFMQHEGQESVENSDRMLEEQERAFLKYGGRHMGSCEGWFRGNVLKRRPFLFFKRHLPFSFCSDVIMWDGDSNLSSRTKKYFV